MPMLDYPYAQSFPLTLEWCRATSNTLFQTRYVTSNRSHRNVNILVHTQQSVRDFTLTADWLQIAPEVQARLAGEGIEVRSQQNPE